MILAIYTKLSILRKTLKLLTKISIQIQQATLDLILFSIVAQIANSVLAINSAKV